MHRGKFLRIERGLSQRQLAALTNLNQSVISQIESGRANPTERELKALARVLGCAPERVMDQVSVNEVAHV